MYRLEWTFYFTGQPVVGQVESDSKQGAVGVMAIAVREAMGNRWSTTHETTMAGISSALMGYMDTDEPVVIRSKSVAITLTKLPEGQ